MIDKKDGGSAFPFDRYLMPGQPQTGMSLRDWFAGQALVGAELSWNESRQEAVIPNVAEFAYRVADAMIAERGK